MVGSQLEATKTPKEVKISEKKRPAERTLRSVIKSISWRTVGTIDTMIISLLLTGELTLAFAIGATEVITKMSLYFFHERLWNAIKWGAADEKHKTGERSIRSITKAISWRTVGTLDTMIISLLVTGELSVAFAIGSVEIVTKMTLYYFHERLWNSIKWGKS